MSKRKSTRRQINSISKTRTIPPKTQPQVEHQQLFSAHSGPLPPPKDLTQYNEAVPGAADRIIVMAEEHSEHVRDLQKKAIDSEFNEYRRGQWMAFTIALVLIAAATYLGIIGREIGAIGLGMAGVSLLIPQFIKKTTSRSSS